MASNRVPMTLRDFFFNDDFFRDAWDDFDKLRQEMLAESAEFWGSVERDMRAMDASMSSNMIKHESSSSSSSSSIQRRKSSSSSENNRELINRDEYSPWFFPRRWMLPRLFNEDLLDTKMRTLDLFQHKDEQVIRLKDDESKFELSLDTHGFRPDELKVDVKGNVLAVEAKHEEKGENKFVARQFSRKYTLPEGCEPHKVVSNLSSDGILLITAPKKQAIKHDGNRSVPIEMKK